jgi:hypothetical protein
MKVAMCFSGLPRGNYKENIARFRRIFPDHDFFFSTWRGYEVEGENYTIYEEPMADYLDVLVAKIKINPYSKNSLYKGYKQIIGHSLQLLFDVPREYDIIVRCRYDSALNEKIDWFRFIEKAYNENTVLGFSSESFLNSRGPDAKRWNCPANYTLNYGYPRLNDQLIFHKRELFSVEKVFELFQKEMLQPSEHGWLQAFPDVVFPKRIYAIKLPKFESFVGGIHLEKTEKEIALMNL